MNLRENDIDRIITLAMKEDAVDHDVTTNLLVAKDQVSAAAIISRENAVVCGLKIAARIFQKYSRAVRLQFHCQDGARIQKNDRVVSLKGPTAAILSCERVTLNFLSHLSGIATLTGEFVKRVAPLNVRIFDTRKTTPGLRLLEKMAVRCGGGENHRFDLSDMVLIKDNHRIAGQKALSLSGAVALVRRKTQKTIEVEVDTLSQFKEALPSGPDIILLDNMSCSTMRQAVKLNRAAGHPCLLEASGGVTLRNVGAIAQTGVDRISVGALTHSARGINFSMEFLS